MLGGFQSSGIKNLFSYSSIFLRSNHHVKNSLYLSAVVSADDNNNSDNQANKLSIKELLRSMKLDKGNPNKDSKYSDRVKELHQIREAKRERVQQRAENENLNWKMHKREQVKEQRAQRLQRPENSNPNLSRKSIKMELSEAIRNKEIKKQTDIEETKNVLEGKRAMPKRKMTRKEVNQKIIESEKWKKIPFGLAEATSAVADELSEGDTSLKTEVEQDLVDQLEKQRLHSKAKLNSVLAGMKVESKKPEYKKDFPKPKSFPEDLDFAMPANLDMMQGPSSPLPVNSDFLDDMTFSEDKPRPLTKKRQPPQPKSLFDDSLHIFTTEQVAAKTKLSVKSDIWEKKQQQEIDSMINQPVNSLEEIIKLTQEGILWRYPIDNEQDALEERGVSFSEHVFLEQYLTLFPDKGPIRHFMELVLIGLSKNAYLTVQEKRNHIMWYKEYFDSKAAIFEQVEQQMKRISATEEEV